MFLPPTYRLLAMGVYLHLSWLFLSFGSIVFGAGLLAGAQRRIESVLLLGLSTFFVYVGVMALDRLRCSMDRSGPGL